MLSKVVGSWRVLIVSRGWQRFVPFLIGGLLLGLSGGLPASGIETSSLGPLSALPPEDAAIASTILPRQLPAGEEPSDLTAHKAAVPRTAPQSAKVRVDQRYGRLPMAFEPNVGQTAPEVRYRHRNGDPELPCWRNSCWPIRAVFLVSV